MRTPLPVASATALDPVRTRLLQDARADAEALVTAADQDAEAVRADAESRAAEILAEARRQGATDARTVQAAVRARARRAARAGELAARRECWEELRRQVAQGVGELRDTPAYPRLRARLTTHARHVLGADARITEALGGGVIGESPGRRIDCGLAALADRALDRIGTEVEELWAP
ncbi:V-type ATP synthase subunit E family protein [Streptomyces sp. NBC_00019]|uniref:V-type ATP synthase subunit E family protein n=1 Tax=Streptomyces sp. NBC_00019 TaxID=2975623 RepID=UPI00324817C2